MTLAGIPVPGHFLHVLLHRRSKVPTLGWGDHGGDREALPRPLRLQCLAESQTVWTGGEMAHDGEVKTQASIWDLKLSHPTAKCVTCLLVETAETVSGGFLEDGP